MPHVCVRMRILSQYEKLIECRCRAWQGTRARDEGSGKRSLLFPESQSEKPEVENDDVETCNDDSNI